MDRSNSRFRSRFVLVVVLALLALMLHAPPARGNIPCEQNGNRAMAYFNAAYVLFLMTGGDFSLMVGPNANELSELECDVDDTMEFLDLIGVTSEQQFVILWSSGPLIPFLLTISFQQPEATAGYVALAATDRRLTVNGRSVADNFRFGVNGGDLDNDGQIDVVVDGMSSLVISGKGGNDTLRASGANGTGGAVSVPTIVRGDTGADVLAGGAKGNTLMGAAGNDRFLLRRSGESVNGGDGSDTITVPNTARFMVNLTEGTIASQSVATAAGYGAFAGAGSTVAAVENVVGSSYADTLTGNGAANRLSGGGGNDLLKGLAGPDTLIGGAGTDTCQGGAGSDTLQSCEKN